MSGRLFFCLAQREISGLSLALLETLGPFSSRKKVPTENLLTLSTGSGLCPSYRPRGN